MSEYALSNDKKGLLVTTGSDGTSIIKVAQKNESIYGKILFFNLSDKSLLQVVYCGPLKTNESPTVYKISIRKPLHYIFFQMRLHHDMNSLLVVLLCLNSCLKP